MQRILAVIITLGALISIGLMSVRLSVGFSVSLRHQQPGSRRAVSLMIVTDLVNVRATTV